MIMRRIAFALAALLAAAAQASAQPHGRGGGTPGDFDFYVLALSWSPGFCELEGDRKGRAQCDRGSGATFVLHGLWPQHERGYPSDCAADRQPTRIAMEAARGVFPDEGLARYQWRKHGTCSGLSPQAYFTAARAARDQVRVPADFREARREERMAPNDVKRAFVAANPGLRADMMGVACRRGVLQEVRICLDRDGRGFRSCPEVARGDCRGGEVSVPAPR
jgi:ribonuclease T2